MEIEVPPLPEPSVPKNVFFYFNKKSPEKPKIQIPTCALAISRRQLFLKIDAPDKRHGKHHDHRRKAHVHLLTSFARKASFKEEHEDQRDDGGNATHQVKHFHFFFIGKLPVRLINKGHRCFLQGKSRR